MELYDLRDSAAAICLSSMASVTTKSTRTATLRISVGTSSARLFFVLGSKRRMLRLPSVSLALMRIVALTTSLAQSGASAGKPATAMYSPMGRRRSASSAAARSP